MGTESIQVSGVINASADQIYDAWLDAHQHSKFTGGTATVEPGIGGKFSAWDGYIQGTTLELEYGRRIVQAWRTTEFPAGSPDSRLEVVLEPIGDATRVTLRHSEIPEGQGGRYEQGWKEHYLTRMTKFFGEDDAAAVDSVERAAPAAPALAEAEEMAVPKPKAEKAPAKKAASPKKASPARKASPKRAKPAKAARAKKRPAKKSKKKAKKKKSSSKSARKKSAKKSSKKAKKSTRSKKRR